MATARTLHAPVFEFGRDFKSIRTSIDTFDYKSRGMSISGLRLAMTGAHQMKNASLAIRVVEELLKQGYNISEAAIREAISSTQFPGRFELLRREPDVIIDGAHTPEGMRLLKSALVKLYPAQKPLFLLGILKDKNVEKLVRTITPIAQQVICGTRLTVTEVLNPKSSVICTWLGHTCQSYGFYRSWFFDPA